MRDRLEETRLLVIGTPEEDNVAADHQVHVAHGAVFVEGRWMDGNYSEELLIVPVNRENGARDAWLLFYRDPEGTDQPLWGRDWCGGEEFTEWDDLVSKVYEL